MVSREGREGEIGVRHHFLTANPFPKKPPVRLVLQDCFLSRFAGLLPKWRG